jgi:hypothetical protein
VAGDLDGLPGGEIGINLPEGGTLGILKLANLGGIIDAFGLAELAKLGHLTVEIGYGFFKCQVIGTVYFYIA